jgi:hypothetical protein
LKRDGRSVTIGIARRKRQLQLLRGKLYELGTRP